MLATWFVNLISGFSIKGKILLSRIGRTKDHVIIAPFNPLAQALMIDLKEAGIKSVVITENKSDLPELHDQNAMALVGVIKSTEVFETAGIRRAKYVIACSDDDLQNALITVTAKNANPRIKIISRVSDEADIPKLSIAGAYWMIKPEITAGEKVADELLKIIV
jgi:voltage-gated potassium channel